MTIKIKNARNAMIIFANLDTPSYSLLFDGYEYLKKLNRKKYYCNIAIATPKRQINP